MKNSHYDKAADRLIEEQLYAQVVQELANGQRRDGLWAKALSDSDGSEERAKSLYIRYRVQALKDEAIVATRLREENIAAQEKEKIVTKRKATLSKASSNLAYGASYILLSILGVALALVSFSSIFVVASNFSEGNFFGGLVGLVLLIGSGYGAFKINSYVKNMQGS